MSNRMNIVIVGHVDHGKSTLIGRLLADTKSLPEGKLEQVKALCEKNSKPFEYAFLLDALQDEQDQGITIDTARVFFKSQKREYIIIDAPGHIEFLKNMISGASRADAAVLLIDAHEGIAENSKRHAYMLSLLGIKQIAVAVNKMDLVNYDQNIFNDIKTRFTIYLEQIEIEPTAFLPVSAREGINLNSDAFETDWFKGETLLGTLDSFEKEKDPEKNIFRMYLQGIYKFSGHNNKKRIYAGTINSGNINVGDEITFYPSGKTSQVNSIESFNTEQKFSAAAGEAIGLTLTEELYVQPTELVCKSSERSPHLTDKFKVNIFWMGRNPLEVNKEYKLKIGTQKITAEIVEIEDVINSSELVKIEGSEKVDKNEVAKCVIQTNVKLPFDVVDELEQTSRFVLVDEYDIAGGGIIVSAVDEVVKNNTSNKYSEFELSLNKLIREHFPHWQLAPLKGD